MTKKFNIGHVIPVLTTLLHFPHSKKDFVKQLAEFAFASVYTIYVARVVYLSQESSFANKKLEDYSFANQPQMTNSHLEKIVK